jgi:hypothetical protein
MAEVLNLAAAATTLLERVAAAPAGRAALTVVADAELRCAAQTLLALRGPAVGRPRRPWAATLQVL